VIVAYIVIVSLALLPLVAFSVLYWKWVPSWVRNPYGRLTQLDSWSQIIVLFLSLVFLLSGTHVDVNVKRVVLTVCLIPFIFIGILRLSLLKKAVDSSKEEDKDKDKNEDKDKESQNV
jgi:hypothetical protein